MHGSLLRGARQQLHAQIAEALEARFPELMESQPELLAQHYAEAGLIEKSFAYWGKAGRRSAASSANLEAAAHLARGIAALSRLPETPERLRQELAMQLTLGPVLLSTRGYGVPEARDPYRRGTELAARLGDDRARFAATWGLWITTHGGGRDDEERLRHLDELFRIADRVGDQELSLQAHHSAWATRIWRGEFIRTREHVRRGNDLYDPDQHRHHALLYGGHDPGVCGEGQGAIALWALGWPDQATQSAAAGVALAERLQHVPSLLHALWFAAAVAHLRRDVAAVRVLGERLSTLGRDHGLKQYQAIGGIFRGWALTEAGSQAEGIAELRAGVGHYGAAAWTMLALFHAILAEAELRAANIEHAEAALAGIENIGNRWWRAEFLRLRGDLQRVGPAADAAAQSYREAILLAHDQQARSLELRAATALARLLRDQGCRADACDLLAPIYGWFTEGFDTPDLKDAKALLDELDGA